MRLVRYDVLRLPCGHYKVYAWGHPNRRDFSKIRFYPALKRLSLPDQPRLGYTDHADAFIFMDNFLRDVGRRTVFEERTAPTSAGKTWNTDLEPVVNRHGEELGKTNRARREIVNMIKTIRRRR